MKKRLLLFVLVTNSFFSQNIKTSDYLNIPEPIPYDQPSFTDGYRNTQQDIVYPIGWSDKHSFAWLERLNPGGMDGGIFRFNVWDMYSDSVISKVIKVAEYDSIHHHHVIRSDISLLYEKYSNDFIPFLSEHNIIPFDYTFYPFPILRGKYLGEAYHVEVNADMKLYSRKEVFDVEISLVRNNKTKKIIYSEHREEKWKGRMPKSIQATGYILHPTLPFIAVLIVETSSNPFEGTPFVMNHKFVVTYIDF